MKKILALAIALMLVLGMTSAFAATLENGTGKIVVNNAVKGETYYAIKALSATASEDGIVYSEPIPAELQEVFEVTTITDSNGTYQVIDKKANVSDSDVQAAMRAFATANADNWGTGVECDGNTVEFEGLDIGYYVIVSTVVSDGKTTLTNKVSAGSTFSEGNTPHTAVGQVYEKNTTTVTVHKDGDDKYSIGDTVEYTVTFNGVNYIGSGEDAEIIIKMEVVDTLPAFLEDVVVTSVKIDDVEKISECEDVADFGTDKSFFIPWASGNDTDGYESLYANGVDIAITYTATLTDMVKIGGSEGNKNVVEIKPYVPGPNGPEPREEDWEDHHEIFTFAAALKKTDGTKALAGAKFSFYGLHAELEDANVPGIYRVTEYNTTEAAAKTLGDELVVDNDGMLYILGINSEVSPVGIETEAPVGYNKLETEVTLTVEETTREMWSAAGTRYFDADGNLISETATSATAKTVEKTIDDLIPTAVEVVNKAGAALPTTGGIGTTLFYVGGGILVLLAVVLLVTKRRMTGND